VGLSLLLGLSPSTGPCPGGRLHRGRALDPL